MIETGALVDLSNIKPNLNREKQPFIEQAVKNLSLRGGSPEDVARVIMASISGVRDTETNEERELVLSGRFLAQGFFSGNLENWNDMLSIVNRNKRERSFLTLLCLEAFYNARRNDMVDVYYDALSGIFKECPSPLANDHRAIRDAIFPKYFVKMPDIELSAGTHRLRRSNSEEEDVMEESPLDVDEGAFFE